MANSYTGAGLIKQVTGENNNTWGDYENTNANIEQLLIAGFLSQAITSGDVTLADADGVADDGKNKAIKTTGVLTGNRALIVPTKPRVWVVWNTNTGAYTMTVKTAAGTGIVVPQGAIYILLGDGTNIVQVTDPSLALTNVQNAWTKQQNFSPTSTLTDAATISWDLSSAQVAKVTLGGSRTLANPTNMVDGGTYILRIIQDGTGSRTLSYGVNYKWVNGVSPTLSTAAGAVDIASFTSDGTYMFGAIQKGFA
jgi:hypothetical protein